MRTPLCDALGIRHPIVSAPMGPDLTGPELVAASLIASGASLASVIPLAFLGVLAMLLLLRRYYLQLALW